MRFHGVVWDRRLGFVSGREVSYLELICKGC